MCWPRLLTSVLGHEAERIVRKVNVCSDKEFTQQGVPFLCVGMHFSWWCFLDTCWTTWPWDSALVCMLVVWWLWQIYDKTKLGWQFRVFHWPPFLWSCFAFILSIPSCSFPWSSLAFLSLFSLAFLHLFISSASLGLPFLGFLWSSFAWSYLVFLYLVFLGVPFLGVHWAFFCRFSLAFFSLYLCVPGLMCIYKEQGRCSAWFLCFRSVCCVLLSAFWTVDFVYTTALISARTAVVLQLFVDVDCSPSCSTLEFVQKFCVTKIMTSCHNPNILQPFV